MVWPALSKIYLILNKIILQKCFILIYFVKWYLLSSFNVGQHKRGVWNIITSSSSAQHFCYLSSGQLNKYTNQAKESILRTYTQELHETVYIYSKRRKKTSFITKSCTLKRGSCTIFIGYRTKSTHSRLLKTFFRGN